MSTYVMVVWQAELDHPITLFHELSDGGLELRRVKRLATGASVRSRHAWVLGPGRTASPEQARSVGMPSIVPIDSHRFESEWRAASDA